MKKSLFGIVVFCLTFMLCACGSADKKFLGYWKNQNNSFEYLKIEKNGDGYLLTRYGKSFSRGAFESRTFSATIKDNTIIIGGIGANGVYKETDNTLIIGGREIFTKIDEEDALKAIKAKQDEKDKAEADCKKLQAEVDIKSQELKDNDEWNDYVKTLRNRRPQGCHLKNAGMRW